MILFAFIGGLILNLMPCVLPVISLKLFGLIVHRDETQKQILKHNMAYSFGVISSFWVLAAVVLAIKSTGDQVGWGFQLQSPHFVFIMATIIFVMSLNLFGLFEFITPGGRKLGNTQMKKGISGDFVSGVIATILSTPCSAPFLGTALTYAFTTSSLNIFLLLTFVGLGLSFPFILTGFFPSLIKFLPKPGHWMEKLKYILGFTMLLTFVWLYDVLGSLININEYNFKLLFFYSLIFFAFFLRKKITKRFGFNLIIFSIVIILGWNVLSQGTLSSTPNMDSKATISEYNYGKWSPEKVKSLKGQYVFIDFTADWCLTCKVNEKLVIKTDSFSNFVKENKINVLIGDWTKRDNTITSFLQSYGVVGVPAYFLVKPNGEVLHLGETISISKIKEKL
jgi:thiol:disulfide interchange protein DsbD